MELIFGNLTAEQELSTIQKMIQQADNNNFPISAVYGELLSFSAKKTRNGSLLIKGELFDGESDIGIQGFVSPNDFPDGIKLKPGQYITVMGVLFRNNYTNNKWCIDLYALAKSEAPPIDKDEADIPRVELQSFLHMSKMRSALSYDKYFEHLASIGHKYGAVTDLNGVQGYPSAYSAAKKHGVQMIYGATLSLASEDNRIVYGPELDEPLGSPIYVSFDVETTGLSVIHDDVIEIAATKFQNGKVLERYQTYVQTSIPISEYTTSLTGITQDKVDNGTSLLNAINHFDSFIKGSVLVAHNATFDRDFISESYRKVGLSFPSYTIIDTLEIARSLNPDAKSNRLNVVAKRYLNQTEAEMKKVNAKIKELDKKIISPYEKDMKSKKPKFPIKESVYHNAIELLKVLEGKKAFLSGRKSDLTLEKHHRADQDAEVTGHIMTEMIKELSYSGIRSIKDLNSLISDDAYKHSFPKEITVIAINEVGKKNLYRLLTQSHLNYLHKVPRVTKKLVNQYREGLLIGSGSHEGPLFELAANKPIQQAIDEAQFYDFLEIQPSSIAHHLVANNTIRNYEAIEITWKLIYWIGKKIGKPVVATGHVHYLNDKENEWILHNILQYHEESKMSADKRKGRKGVEQKGRHFRRTSEMLNEFPWLTEEERYEVVVTNSNNIAQQCLSMAPVPDKLYPPKIKGADEELSELAISTAKKIYGAPLPVYVKERLSKELKSIITNGFSVIYLIAQKLVKNSNDNGYLVGSRGSVGSSFVATMTGITEVNPLKPHYVSESGKWSIFFDHEEIRSGYDLPNRFGDLLDVNKYSDNCRNYIITTFAKSLGKTKDEIVEFMLNHKPNTCPITGELGLIRDGQDIPFETFLGFKGDKVPDIDLNFSGEYQTTSHKYVEELFGERNVFRAGTIGTVADKKAYGYVISYSEENSSNWSSSIISRHKTGIIGAKNTSGQHPGGILVVPDYMEPEDFTPVQYPADEESKNVRTSHFDFHSIHDNILKLDILGHDDPTIIRMLQDMTGVHPSTVAPNDEMALKLFTEPGSAMGINMDDIVGDIGTLGVPEFGTNFVMQMIKDTKPKTFAELVSISGLSHGTDVWIGNAKNLIEKEICTLGSVIDTRDNIMVYLIQKGLEPSLAFLIMEDVRKGKGLKPEYVKTMLEHNVPEWYIESCNKIKYMFPKAHAAAYVLSAMRIANFKVKHPMEFYAAVMSVRYNKESFSNFKPDISELRDKINENDKTVLVIRNKEPNKADKLDRTNTAMKLVLEAKVRGVEFGDISIEESHAMNYIIKNGKIIPPFRSIEGIGENAAWLIYNAFKEKPFSSFEDMSSRGIKPAVIDKLRAQNCLEKLEDIQFRLF